MNDNRVRQHKTIVNPVGAKNLSPMKLVGAKDFLPLHNHDPQHHHRRSIRLAGYDYSQVGAYFVTVCAQGQMCLFGEIRNGEMYLNDVGRIVEQCWNEIPTHFPDVKLDEYVIMPNHVHGILIITDAVGAKNFSPLQTSLQTPHGTSKTIGSIIHGFKIGVTKWFRQYTEIVTVWQRNYYEHIIRNEESLHRIREYIVNNPLQWEFDRENPVGAYCNTPLPKDEPWRI